MSMVIGRKLKRTTVGDMLIYLIMTVTAYATLYPFLLILFESISDPSEVAKNPLILYPRGVTFEIFYYIFKEPKVTTGFKNSFIYTITSTLLTVLFTTMCAYPMSKPGFRPRRFLMVMFLIPMFFGGGFIPTYLIIQSLGLVDTMWALVLPGAVGTFNLILVRTFIEGLPNELFEAAVIDGANDLTVFFRIVIPLSTPILATIAMFAAVGQWNSYFGPLLYLNDPEKYNLQVFLRQLVIKSQLSEMAGNASVGSQSKMAGELASMRNKSITESLKAGVLVVSTLPILIVYPFLQRYYIKGIMLGAIKG